MTGSSPMVKVFLSYRRTDGAVVKRLYDALMARLGSGHVFMDCQSILLGEDWRRALERALAECDVLVVVIGPDWVSAVDDAGRRRLEQEEDYVRLEIEEALRRNLRVIPVLIQGAAMPHPQQLPAGLQSLADVQAQR